MYRDMQIKTKIMGMYSLKSYKLLKDEYDYLLPVLRKNLSNFYGDYSFCGDTDELYDMLSRLKGLYNYFDTYNGIIDYKCAKNHSLEPFRNEMKRLSFINKFIKNG